MVKELAPNAIHLLRSKTLSGIEIARKLNVTGPTVSKWRKLLGITVKNGRPYKVSDAQIIRVHDLRLSTTKAGEKLGVDHSAILYRYEKLGLKPFGVGRPGKSG